LWQRLLLLLLLTVQRHPMVDTQEAAKDHIVHQPFIAKGGREHRSPPILRILLVLRTMMKNRLRRVAFCQI
jgi:hypothetical protein